MQQVHNESSRFLGIDPGTRRVGYGIVERRAGKLSLVDAGLLTVTSTNDADALFEIKSGIAGLLRTSSPEAVAIEKLYFAKNQKTALQVAEARGVIIATVREHGTPIIECNPNEIKLSIAGYGNADKRAVAKMVRLTLGVTELHMIDDASDALALAILCAERNRRDLSR